MKFSHKAEIIEAHSTNLVLKEGEDDLAKHGDGVKEVNGEDGGHGRRITKWKGRGR